MPIYLLTQNTTKKESAARVFAARGIEVVAIASPVPEIQAETSLEIARHSAVEAARLLDAPVIREDHSMFIHALGIPGPYAAYAVKHLSAQKLLQILALEKDRTAHFTVATVYAEPNGTIKECVYDVPVHFKEQDVVPDPHGGWNGLFCLQGETRAFTEYPEAERLFAWERNFVAIADWLLERNAGKKE